MLFLTTHPWGPPDVCLLPFPPQTTGVDLVVKTVPVPDTGDSVVSGPLAPPRELGAAPALPEDSMATVLLPGRQAALSLGNSDFLALAFWGKDFSRET